jgi:hypothetical protein
MFRDTHESRALKGLNIIYKSVNSDTFIFEDKNNVYIFNCENNEVYKNGLLAKISKGRTDNNGGFYLSTTINGYGVRLHRLSCYLVYGDQLFGREVDHIDGNRINNHIDNLRLCTRAENAKYASDRGVWLKNRYYGKLRKEDVENIRWFIKEGFRNKEIAELYQIDPSNISKIRHNKSFKHD